MFLLRTIFLHISPYRRLLIVTTYFKYLRSLPYTLQIFLDNVQRASDNKFVLVNSGTPHSQLKKKSNSVAYPHVREGSTLDEWRTTYINMNENITDLMTKNLPSGVKRTKFCKMLLHFLTPSIRLAKKIIIM